MMVLTEIQLKALEKPNEERQIEGEFKLKTLTKLDVATATRSYKDLEAPKIWFSKGVSEILGGPGGAGGSSPRIPP